MRHGDRQVHDLEGAPPAFDQDWIRVATQVRHSYEARVTGNYWDFGCGAPPCPLLRARERRRQRCSRAARSTADDAPNSMDGIGLGMTSPLDGGHRRHRDTCAPGATSSSGRADALHRTVP